jgi:microsomal dipeptidase-like Zn-dependent dipeptidase
LLQNTKISLFRPPISWSESSLGIYIGSGCYESHDSGLSDFGREVVAEMNRIGIAVDLSHVGSKTTDDTIEFGVPPKMMSQ